MFAATTFFRSARMFWRINWMLASLTCSSVVFMPLAADGAACWALRTVVATNTAAAKQSGKAMFFFNFGLSFSGVHREGWEGHTGTSDRCREELISEDQCQCPSLGGT